MQAFAFPLRTLIVSTVSADTPELSPFHLGPCDLYGGHTATNVENGWQFSKVYPEHWDPGPGRPLESYWLWAASGWQDPRPRRYPFGRARKPVGSWWRGKLLDYITARKRIYAPLYAEQVTGTLKFR